jgi:hypothetical protein
MEKYLNVYNSFTRTNIAHFDKIIFLRTLINEYFMFYNETSLINPNNFNIKFPIDGMLYCGNEIFYYVGFEESNKNDMIKKLNYSHIIIINMDGTAIEEFVLQKQLLKTPALKQLKLLYDVRLMNTTSFFLHQNKIKKYNITSQDYNAIIPHVQSKVTIDEFEKETDIDNDDLLMVDDFEKCRSSPSPNNKKKLIMNKSSEDNIYNFKKTQSEILLEEYDVLS